ncbi:MAG: hypothetical protein IPK18_07850 [Sphingobacteriales bacterium]|jgi:hypothetical protein|nr:MAG: hypothetical protein IPK18_07850 [Sphingobacteriales bacterium]
MKKLNIYKVMLYLFLITIFLSSCDTFEVTVIPRYPVEGLWYSKKQGSNGISSLNYSFFLKENNQLTVNIDNGTTEVYAYYGTWRLINDTVRMGWYYDARSTTDSSFFYYKVKYQPNSTNPPDNPSPTNGSVHAYNPYYQNALKVWSKSREFVRQY